MNLSKLIPFLGLALIASCDKGGVPVIPEEPTPSSFNKLTISSEVLSKAALMDGQLDWAKGDSVSILCGSTNTIYVAQAAGKSVEFVGEEVAAGQSSVYAVYPCNSSATLSGGKLKVSLPSQQKLGRSVADTSATLCVGPVKYDGKMFKAELKNLCSFVEIEIKGSGVKSVSIEGNDGELLSGAATLDISKGSLEIEDPEEAFLSVEMAPQGAYFTPGKYLLAVLPSTLSKGYSIYYEKEDGKASFKTVYHASDPVTLESGKVLAIPSKETEAIAQRTVNLGTFYSDVSNAKYFDGIVPSSSAMHYGYFNAPITERVDFPYCFGTQNGCYKYSSGKDVRIKDVFTLPYFAHKTLKKITVKASYSLDASLKDSEGNVAGAVSGTKNVATDNSYTTTLEGVEYSISKSGNIDIVAIVMYYEGPDVEEVCAVTVSNPSPEGSGVTLSGKMYAFNYSGSTGDYSVWFEYKLSGAENYTRADATFNGAVFNANLSSLAPGEYVFRAYAQKGSDKAIHSQDRKFTIQ